LMKDYDVKGENLLKRSQESFNNGVIGELSKVLIQIKELEQNDPRKINLLQEAKRLFNNIKREDLYGSVMTARIHDNLLVFNSLSPQRDQFTGFDSMVAVYEDITDLENIACLKLAYERQIKEAISKDVKLLGVTLLGGHIYAKKTKDYEKLEKNDENLASKVDDIEAAVTMSTLAFKEALLSLRGEIEKAELKVEIVNKSSKTLQNVRKIIEDNAFSEKAKDALTPPPPSAEIPLKPAETADGSILPEAVAQAVPLAADGPILPKAAAVPVAEAVAVAAEALAAEAEAAEALAAEAALVEADEPGKMQVTREEEIFKYLAILKKYSESKGTVFQVDPENNTVKVPAQASISQKPKDGLERIQEEVEVKRNGKTFTITAFTDVGKDVSKKDEKKIRKRLKGLVASIKNDKDFLNKLKEASDLKDELSKDTNLLLDNLNNKPDLDDPENSELKGSIRDKMKDLEARNEALGAKLSNNLKNRDLGKLEKFKNKISSILKRLRNQLPTVLNGSTISQKLPPAAAAEIPDGSKPLGIMPSELALDKEYAEHLKHCKGIDDSMTKEGLASKTLETSGKLDTSTVEIDKLIGLTKPLIDKSEKVLAGAKIRATGVVPLAKTQVTRARL
jgi:hypothetical protein